MTSWAKSHVLAVDTAMTVLVAALFLVIVTTTGSIPGVFFSCPATACTLWQIAILIPVATRRWRPEPSAWAITTVAVAQLIIGPALVPADLFALSVLYAVIVYGNPSRSRLFACLALAIGILASLALAISTSVGPVFGDPGSPNTVSLCEGNDPHTCAQNFLSSFTGGLIIITLCIVTAIFLGYWQRARNVTITMLQERNEALQAGENERRRIAALAERARIARDMHDVVAHTLSIIIVQSDGGRYAGASNPQIAKHTMHTIEHESQRAMRDMQHLLGVFGEPDHADYRHVATLLDEAGRSDADIQIRFHSSGEPHPARLSETASTAMYRMVQEALTNIRKYAGPNVNVDVEETWSDTGLTVRVADDGRGASAAADGHKPGFGLLGMRERIAMAHGSVQAGPRLSGGFEVVASVPYRDAEHEAELRATTSTATSPAPGACASAARQSQEVLTGAGEPSMTATDIQHSNTVSDAPAPVRQSRQDAIGGGRTPMRQSITPASLPLPAHPMRISDMLRRCFNNGRPALPPAERGANGATNTVERMSMWWERHYLASDILSGLIFVAFFGLSGVNVGNNLEFILTGNQIHAIGQAVIWAVTVLVMLPWMFRRRFPRASAIFAFVFAIFQLLVMPCILFVNIMSLGVLAAAILYGDRSSTKRAIAAASTATCMCALCVFSGAMGYTSLLAMLADLSRLQRPSGARLIETGSALVTVGLMCLIAIVAAIWKRTSGNDALVLQAREQALNEEARRQQVLAANVERDRISANIQSEVTDTLQSVIACTHEGLAMFERAEKEGTEPDAAAVSEAFKQIGEQGRAALARMRELLGVLRKTGFSDETHDRSADIAPLAPVSPPASASSVTTATQDSPATPAAQAAATTPAVVSDALPATETTASGTAATTAESAG
ncbi:MAG: histidine kinase [Bifidobacterium sp.]|uniref:sensor histidine kinase n=1 Tax=Bifidobacterium sp. TaxID=41200 RepID=UPI003F077D89